MFEQPGGCVGLGHFHESAHPHNNAYDVQSPDLSSVISA
jgi:hypothetical protein